eukprot:CAMPEP_0194061300 /NCGR_PEP_ID=MMETSP0009_2-20130614/74234_1 /TAXON_ID=210454 /ORGANISM="Grammatophora oceanica, Strain CCMP 410" /LENGTH=189 /DNA_ID=CAMNT_0038712565 /DNA_START=50 /DNA_END=619 /DNA_ORIENTATION=-
MGGVCFTRNWIHATLSIQNPTDLEVNYGVIVDCPQLEPRNRENNEHYIQEGLSLMPGETAVHTWDIDVSCQYYACKYAFGDGGDGEGEYVRLSMRYPKDGGSGSIVEAENLKAEDPVLEFSEFTEPISTEGVTGLIYEAKVCQQATADLHHGSCFPPVLDSGGMFSGEEDGKQPAPSPKAGASPDPGSN